MKATIHLFKFISVCVLLTFVNCSFILVRVDKPMRMGDPYIGTERSIKFVKCGAMILAPTCIVPPVYIFGLLFYIIDIPLTFILETILLPFDLFIKSKGRSLPHMSCH